MLTISSKDAVRFTPGWQQGDGAPVYLLRAGSVIDRAQLEAELAGEHNAGRVFAFELMEAFRTGVLQLLGSGDDAGQVLAIAAAEMALQPGEKLPDDEARTLAEARDVLAQHWPDYRAIRSRQSRRQEMAPLLAFRRFCIGWENVSAPFTRGPNGLVTDEALGQIDPLELIAAGGHAFGLLYPTDQEGNSQRPSQSGDGPKISKSDAPSKAVGKSPARGGRKTR